MVAQDRIDQQAPAPKLHIPGTVPQPEDEVMGGQGAQIGFDDRQGPGGPQSLVAAEIKIPEHRQMG